MSHGDVARRGQLSREEILDAALEVVDRVGYSGATVRELAAKVGLSQAGLLHHFGSKDDLFAEILRRSDSFDVEKFGHEVDADGAPLDLAATFVRVVRHHQEVPGLVRLYIRLTAAATDPDHPDHAFFRERGDYARRIAAEGFRKLQREQKVAADLDPEVLATLMLALQDGLRLQWLADPELDMPHHVSEFFALIERVTRGSARRSR